MYEFPSAAVTNQGKLSLKQAKSIVLPFWRSEANKSERAKIKGSARLTPSADSVEESVHLFLQLVKAASIAWLVATSLQFLSLISNGLSSVSQISLCLPVTWTLVIGLSDHLDNPE